MSGRVARVDEVEPRARARSSGSAERLARRRVVAQLGSFTSRSIASSAEAVHAALDPEAHHVLHRRHDLRVAPVEVGLLGIEGVQVPAPARSVAVHAGPPKADDPVVRRPVARSAQMYQSGCSRNHGCSIDVWQGTRSISTRSPRSWAAATSRSKSSSVPKTRVDVRVVGDVVAEVGQRRRVDGREPERVHAQPREVVEPLPDARAGPRRRRRRVLERARIDLVDDPVLPPHGARG